MTLVETARHPSSAVTDAVAVDGLTKRFAMPVERHSSVRDHVLHPRAHRRAEMLTALRDVSFEVQRGSCVGIVGRNGSGKSTLLRCMAGIYVPDAGDVRIRGRLAAFIELGIGFDRELTARDNVITSGMLFGLSARDLRARFDEIMAYAELEDFSEVKLKNYSTGMAMRLAFALTTHVDADVLLFDEAIATGDLAFQRKSLARFAQLRSEGRTLVLVTHEMHLVQALCDRAIMLDRGRIVFEGDGTAVADHYDAVNLPTSATWRETRRRQRAMDASGDGPATAPRSRTAEQPALRHVGASDHRQTLRIAIRFALVQYKLKYTEAVLGYAWAIMRPLALFAVLYVVFTRVAHLDRGVPHYALYLLTSLVLWTAFLDSTTNATFSLVGQAELLRKAQVPRAAVPLSVVLRAHMDLVMNLLVVFVFVALSSITPRASWLELPILALGLTVLGLGFSLLLSALYVRLRDVDQLWSVLAQILFFGSAILYVVGTMPAGLRRPLILFNPLAAIFTQIRHALIDPHAPTAAAVAGGQVYLLVPIAVTAAIIALGAAVFARMAPTAAEYL